MVTSTIPGDPQWSLIQYCDIHNGHYYNIRISAMFTYTIPGLPQCSLIQYCDIKMFTNTIPWHPQCSLVQYQDIHHYHKYNTRTSIMITNKILALIMIIMEKVQGCQKLAKVLIKWNSMPFSIWIKPKLPQVRFPSLTPSLHSFHYGNSPPFPISIHS